MTAGPEHWYPIAARILTRLRPPGATVQHQPDPMPVFTIKAKDDLAVDAIDHYMALCQIRGLDRQATEVWKAREEIREWQERNEHLVQLPDHDHVPVTNGVAR